MIINPKDIQMISSNHLPFPMGGEGRPANEMLRYTVSALKKAHIKDAEKEAEIILTEGIGIEKVSFYRDNPLISYEQTRMLNQIIKQRQKRQPLHYILGYTEFYGLKIKVGEGVLIPRPETEFLVEECIKRVTIPFDSRLSLLDLGTGSGCIAIALAKHFPHAKLYGVDISETALRYAEENKKDYGLKNLTLLQGNLFEPFKGIRGFDLIVSNPPYIKSSVINELEPEIREWEPISAIDGGEDGLYFYRKILQDAPIYLKPDGLVVLEIGDCEKEDVEAIASAEGFSLITKRKDYTNIDRVLVFKRL